MSKDRLQRPFLESLTHRIYNNDQYYKVSETIIKDFNVNIGTKIIEGTMMYYYIIRIPKNYAYTIYDSSLNRKCVTDHNESGTWIMEVCHYSLYDDILHYIRYCDWVRFKHNEHLLYKND